MDSALITAGGRLFLSIISFVLLLGSFFYFRNRRRQARLREPGAAHQEHSWDGVTQGLFEHHGPQVPQDRVETALRTGMRRLGLSHGLIAFHQGENCTILHAVSDSYEMPFSPGAIISRKQIFCGVMAQGRDSLVIDFASLSDWRKHAAYQDLGWEAYIGVRIALAEGGWITIGFVSSYPRDSLFSRSEKEFVGQLSQWIFALLQREKAIAPPTFARAEEYSATP